MARVQTGNFDAAQVTYARLRSPGLLLVGGAEKPNIMTIGWGTLGVIWSKPVFSVLVRPSRYTHDFLENHGEFCVCVPTEEMKDAVMLCGTKSGRDVDKVAQCSFTMEQGMQVKVPFIAQCPLHYECRTVHSNQVLPARIDAGIKVEYYPYEDYHTIYHGEILGVYREA